MKNTLKLVKMQQPPKWKKWPKIEQPIKRLTSFIFNSHSMKFIFYCMLHMYDLNKNQPQ